MNRFATMTLAAACAFTMYGQGGRGGGPVTLASNLKQTYNAVKNNITAAADQMPEAGYGFLPEGEPRSFAGWVGHVADIQAAQCGGISGTALQLGAGQMTTKADLVAALKKSFDACDAVFNAVTDENAMESFAGRGGAQPKAVGLYGVVIHSNECYGAMAVYLRLQKLTPPSSAGRGGGGGGRGGRGGPKQ
jgi:hypothetical protein